jgi:hypothetical protein
MPWPPDNAGGGPVAKPPPQDPPGAARQPEVAAIIARRQRQVRRLATIELVWQLYGAPSLLGLSPPGPDCCPDGCPFCATGVA